MKIRQLSPESLIPYEGNPRIITQEAIDAAAHSIESFGFRQNIVTDKNLVIVVGHTRRLAALQLGLKKVPVEVVTDLSDEDLNAYRLADNKTGEFSIWEIGKLRVEIEELNEVDYDLSKTAFDEIFIDSLLEPIAEAETPEEKATSGKLPEETEFTKKKFTFHNEQRTVIDDALTLARTSPIVDTGVNDSANANAMTLICREWLEMKAELDN